MEQFQNFGRLNELPAVVVSLASLTGAVLLGLLAYIILFKVLLRFAARPETPLHKTLVHRWRQPVKLLLPLLVVLLTLPTLQFPDRVASLLQQLCSLALILAIAWLLSVTILGLQEMVLLHYDVIASDRDKSAKIFCSGLFFPL